jgi:hypothetical protein
MEMWLFGQICPFVWKQAQSLTIVPQAMCLFVSFACVSAHDVWLRMMFGNMAVFTE